MRISGKTRLVALLGSPVSHSQSPALHNGAFEALDLDFAYLAFDVGLPELGDAVRALRTLKARGANVTMPLKQAICAHLDRLSPTAELAGAVNTVVNDDGFLTGHITDGAGYMMSLDEAGVDYVGSAMTIVGVGGAATAVAVEAAMRGVKTLHLFNRRDAFYPVAQTRVARLCERFDCDARLFDLEDAARLSESLAASRILVNATPLGMEATLGQSVLADARDLHPGLVVSDLIYEPAETALLRMARGAGCRTVNGAGMQLFQGALAFALWTGRTLPVELGRSVLGAPR